jgi:hypothetical protein
VVALFSRSSAEPDRRPRTLRVQAAPTVSQDHRVLLADVVVRCVPRAVPPDQGAGPAWGEDDERSLEVLVTTLLRVHAAQRRATDLVASPADVVGVLDQALSVCPALAGWSAATTSAQWRDDPREAISPRTWQVEVDGG